MPKRRFMDALEDTSESGSSSSGSEKEEEGKNDLKTKKQRKDVSVEDLQRCGYKGGPSVLFIPQHQAETEINTQWSNGRAHKEKEAEKEDWEDREETRRAVNEGAQETAEFAGKSVEQFQKLKQARREEQSLLAQERRLTFRQKEKRKRDAGQVKRSTNFVEEEKRRGREFGMYSGFD